MDPTTFHTSDHLTTIAQRYNSGKWIWDQREAAALDLACVLALDGPHWLSDRDLYQLAFIRHELASNPPEPEWMAEYESNL